MPKQRSQQAQIICICADICAFSILDNRHLADICAICQKCQFGVRKAWKALFLQFKPQEMHYKQADSAILKLFVFYSILQLLKIRFACILERICAFVVKCDMLQKCAFWGFFRLGFDSDKCDLTQTLLRHLVKTLPEAQRTQGIASLTWVISPANKKNATCIGSKFGHQVAPLASVTNSATRWRHLH